ncbi:MAG: hypothetical protein K8J31_25975 [Anaerolineae bacterium]|nr:hypothetical protein [Anaerolineae bacterium]
MLRTMDCFFHTELVHIRRDIRRLERRLYALYEDDNPCMASDRALLAVNRKYLDRVETLSSHCNDLPAALKICQGWLQDVQRNHKRTPRGETNWAALHELDYLTDLVERLQEAMIETVRA